jgi:hypothetical protein
MSQKIREKLFQTKAILANALSRDLVSFYDDIARWSDNRDIYLLYRLIDLWYNEEASLLGRQHGIDLPMAVQRLLQTTVLFGQQYNALQYSDASKCNVQEQLQNINNVIRLIKELEALCDAMLNKLEK